MRSKIVAALPKLSWGAFIATVILTPFRLHLILVARPVGTIWRDYTDFLLYASDIALLLTVLPWLLGLLLRHRKPDLAPFFVTLPLAALTLLGGVSSFSSVDSALSAYLFVRLLVLFCFYLYVTNNVKSLQQLIVPLSAQVVIQAIVAITQVLRQKSLGLELIGEWTLNPTIRGISVIWTETSRSLRAYGLSDHPNILGGSLVFAILILFVWLSYEKGKERFFQASIFSIGVVALFLTYSRSAWLAWSLGFALIGFLIYKAKRRDWLVRGALLIAGAAMVLLPFVLANGEFLGVRLGADHAFERVKTEVASIEERAVLNRAANEVFIEHSITGVGIGTLPEALRIKYPNFAVFYQPGHVVLLDVAAETGLFGALFYLILLITPWMFLTFQRPKKFTPDLIAASGLLLAVSAVGFFDYYTWLSAPGRIWQWLALGLWGKFYSDARRF
jgi:O-antigen ligase